MSYRPTKNLADEIVELAINNVDKLIDIVTKDLAKQKALHHLPVMEVKQVFMNCVDGYKKAIDLNMADRMKNADRVIEIPDDLLQQYMNQPQVKEWMREVGLDE